MIKHFLSCDWGTTSFRLRLVNTADGTVLEEITRDDGTAVVYADWRNAGLPQDERLNFYKRKLRDHIEELSSDNVNALPLIISGMASSSIGITEIPYGDLPFTVAVDQLTVIKIAADEKFCHDIFIVSGLKTENDVMRGEETMLVGCDIEDGTEQLIIFPGTHSKHVVIKNNVLTDFKTYITGEMFGLLANKSILSNSIKKGQSDSYNREFEMGVRESVSNNLLNAVFHVRTNHLFTKMTPMENYSFLSGLIIGTELKAIPATGVKIHLVCGEEMSNSYQTALQLLCRCNSVVAVDADKALVNGHCKLANYLFK